MKKITAAFFVLVGCMQHDINQPDPTTDPSTDSSSNTPDMATSVHHDAGSDATHISDGSSSDSSDNGQTGNDCGGPNFPKCGEGQTCLVDSDCIGACNYNHVCVEGPSCKVHYGGNTCGQGQLDDAVTQHESCCRSLPVIGYVNPLHPGKQLYLDRYEITAGRMRAFVDAVIKEEGKPDFKNWVKKHRPATWSDEWNKFIPSDYEGDKILISRYLLGDPRHLGQSQAEAGPGVILVPDEDQLVSTGLNHQFGSTVYVESHGSNCDQYPGDYGFPTYWYADSILAARGEVPRKNPIDKNGQVLNAKDILDAKALNCTPNYMFQLFCSWAVGGEMETSEVFDYVTDSPNDRPISVSGCGVQFSNHSDLLGNIIGTSVFTGGRCMDAYSGSINLFFDAGQNLPMPGYPLNANFFHWPDYQQSADDKSWVVAEPGRMKDIVHLTPNDVGWKDMAGNLTESVMETNRGIFNGLFSLRGQGIGYGSERSDGVVLPLPSPVEGGVVRGQRPEIKSGLVTSRCQVYR